MYYSWRKILSEKLKVPKNWKNRPHIKKAAIKAAADLEEVSVWQNTMDYFKNFIGAYDYSRKRDFEEGSDLKDAFNKIQEYLRDREDETLRRALSLSLLLPDDNEMRQKIAFLVFKPYLKESISIDSLAGKASNFLSTDPMRRYSSNDWKEGEPLKKELLQIFEGFEKWRKKGPKKSVTHLIAHTVKLIGTFELKGKGYHINIAKDSYDKRVILDLIIVNDKNYIRDERNIRCTIFKDGIYYKEGEKIIDKIFEEKGMTERLLLDLNEMVLKNPEFEGMGLF